MPAVGPLFRETLRPISHRYRVLALFAAMISVRVETLHANDQWTATDSLIASVMQTATQRDSTAWFRVDTLDEEMREGTASWDRNLILLTNGEDSHRIRIDHVVAIWQRGISRRKGMALGAIIGATVGFFAFYALTPNEVSLYESSETTTTSDRVSHGLIGAAACGVVGLVAGTMSSSRTWTQIYP